LLSSGQPVRIPRFLFWTPREAAPKMVSFAPVLLQEPILHPLAGTDLKIKIEAVYKSISLNIASPLPLPLSLPPRPPPRFTSSQNHNQHHLLTVLISRQSCPSSLPFRKPPSDCPMMMPPDSSVLQSSLSDKTRGAIGVSATLKRPSWSSLARGGPEEVPCGGLKSPSASPETRSPWSRASTLVSLAWHCVPEMRPSSLSCVIEGRVSIIWGITLQSK